MIEADAEFVQYFWSKINVCDEDDCWEWKESVNSAGYGSIWCGHGKSRRKILAHRASWEMAHQQEATGFVVMHSCDNRKCVNPKHLSLGTQKDNMRDTLSKFRENPAIGERSGMCKMTDLQVKEARELYATGTYTQKSIAKIMNVSGKHISLLVRHKVRTGRQQRDALTGDGDDR